MEMEYWRKEETDQVYGFDVSDPAQVVAMNNLLASGTWTNVTANWPPPPAPPTADQNKSKAVSLLQETDWVNEPDVYDVANTPHLLNRQEFLDYRTQVRPIAVTPSPGNLNWPTLPTAQWSS